MTSSGAPPAPPQSTFDPFNQTFYITGPHDAHIPVWVPMVDYDLYIGLSTSINYGSQIGACFIMLLVVLTMTTKARFSRASTLVNIAGLAIGVVRCTLLALYFVSSYFEFYVLVSGDHSHISANDVRLTVAASFFAIPQLILIEVGLSIQAYSMIRLWPPVWKALALTLSALIAVCTIVFKCIDMAEHMRSTIYFRTAAPGYWVQELDLAFTAVTIFWFCFIFIVRLVVHMAECRSILPPLGGVSAMEVLVMTNGILMLIPVMFAALELSHFTKFESGALTMTSVVVVLPLGTLIAQSMTRSSQYVQNNNASGSAGVSSGRRGRRTGGDGTGDHKGIRSGLRSGLSRVTHFDFPNRNSISSVGDGGDSYRQKNLYCGGRDEGTTTTTVVSASSTKKMGHQHMFGTWSQNSDATMAALIPGTGSTHTRMHSGGDLKTAGQSSYAKGKSAVMLNSTDQELQAIDATSPTSTAALDNRSPALTEADVERVWVGREVEVRHDLV